MRLETEAYHKLLSMIFKLILERGIKGLTMDTVASSLSISKRTLYEIFDSKSDMIVKTMSHMNEMRRKVANEAYLSAPNSLIGILRIFFIQREFICNVNVNFFRDMDQISPDIREYYREQSERNIVNSQYFFKQGIEEGVLRDDIDFTVQFRILEIQMESLKRMEEHFPPEITLIRAYDAIYVGFLRGIVSPKGMEMLDEIIKDPTSIKQEIEKYLYRHEVEN